MPKSLWRPTAAELLRLFKYGDMIDHYWLQGRLGLIPPQNGTQKEYSEIQFQLVSDIENIKARLLYRHHIYLENVRGKGYLMVNPSDQTSKVWDLFVKRLFKLFVKVSDGLIHIDTSQMTSAERAENMSKLATLAAVKGVAQRKMLTQKYKTP